MTERHFVNHLDDEDIDTLFAGSKQEPDEFAIFKKRFKNEFRAFKEAYGKGEFNAIERVDQIVPRENSLTRIISKYRKWK